MEATTAVFSPEEMMKLDGIDHLHRMSAVPNPFWNRARFEITWALPSMCGLLDRPAVTVAPMRIASRDELRIYHDISYIETIELFGNLGNAFSSRFGLDTDACPVFQDFHLYAAYPVGASIDSVMGVATGRFKNAVSFYGGLHHATESRASGFCYYNDCVIAIKKYRAMFPDKRVLYLDTDVHHGDGTQQAFYVDRNVLTISTHEFSLGFFPGTGQSDEIGYGDGKGYSVNIPLPPLTDDFEFWRAFEDVIVPIWSAYKPDLVFWDVGADCHQGDPLADLMLTNDTYVRMAKTAKKLTHRHGSGLVITGGGGYNPVSTAKVWTLVLAEIAGLSLPPELPREWIDLCARHGYVVDRDCWTDRPHRVSCEHESNIRRAVDEAISAAKTQFFPVFGL
ncbi:MAG: acetoin utilization protein AcuC [Candidatus Thorarchaeota archaeon]|nr:acetoin utilization protein AcuC [Candidatus Thorarchaeota archaeon]